VVDGYASLITSLEKEGALNRELEQLPTDSELAKRKAEGRGLTTPELAVVIANVKNRYKRILGALPLLDLPWAKSVLTPYFPAKLVATRDALKHPLANTILATVLANESVNRCGPLMLRDLAVEHGVDEADVVKAWGQAWSALNLAPAFGALDADALKVPRAVSIKVDARTRVLFHGALEGVLAVPGDAQRNAAPMAELTSLFTEGGMLQQLMPAQAEADAVAGLPAGYAQAWKAVDAIEAVATFLFAAVSVSRPAGMSLSDFLKVGMNLRGQAGIDTLERGLKLASTSKSQEQLRNYALQALRRTQQRLLLQVLAKAKSGVDTGTAVEVVTNTMGLSGYALATDLDQAMLDVWALSEAANAVA
jgi:glutamate dehydrogenase